jgi:hypothetical protein
VFIGHLALGFAAKRTTPSVSLAVLFAAVQFADLLWPVLVALGVERVRIDPGNTAFTPLDFESYPYSHSLLFLLLWGALFGFVYRQTSGNRRTFLVLAALVVSHWVLDVLTHRPDMPLYPGGPKIGFGLWNSIPATLVIELALYAAGLAVYARTTRAQGGTGRWAFVGLAVLLVVIYFVNLLGPPPPSVPAVSALAFVGGAILILWAWWVDRHREPRRA